MGAIGLHDQIDRGVLLTREGDGHASYFVPGASRTRDAIDTYLVTGETPPAEHRLSRVTEQLRKSRNGVSRPAAPDS